MKRLLTLIAFALIGLTANAQTLKTRTDGTFTQLDQRLAVGKSFLLPSGPDTTLNGGLTIPGQLFYRTTDSTVYVWKGDKWHKVGSESGGIIKVGNGLSLEADSVILGGFLHKENTDINMRSNDVKYLNFNLENDYGELGYATKALWLNISNLPQLSLTTVDESDPENQKSAAFIVDPTAFFGAAPPSVLRLNSKYPGPPRADLWLEKLTDTIGFSVVDTAATILKKVNGKYTSLYVGGSTGGLFIKDDISNKGLSYKKYLADWNTTNDLWVTPKRYVDSVANKISTITGLKTFRQDTAYLGTPKTAIMLLNGAVPTGASFSRDFSSPSLNFRSTTKSGGGPITPGEVRLRSNVYNAGRVTFGIETNYNDAGWNGIFGVGNTGSMSLAKPGGFSAILSVDSLTNNRNSILLPDNNGMLVVKSDLPRLFTYTASGDATTSIFSVAHGLTSPTMVIVTANTEDAMGKDINADDDGTNFYAVINGANIDIKYRGGRPPIAGTNNLKWSIMVK